jgi:hypothetical protein
MNGTQELDTLGIELLFLIVVEIDCVSFYNLSSGCINLHCP